MFDLEAAITQWKESFEANDSVVSDDILELETHLRESTVSLAEGKLNQEEAFLVARSRLGGASELSDEFAKTNTSTTWQKNALWMLNGGIMLRLGTDLVPAFTQLTASFFVIGNVGATATTALIFGIALISWMILLALVYKLSLKTPSVTHSILLFIMLLFTVPITMTTNVIQVRLLSPEQFGGLAQTMFYQNFILRYGLLLFLVASLWILRNRKTETPSVIS